MARKPKLAVRRRSFDLDTQTLDDLKTVQLALRCRSGTEAVREAIRRTAQLLVYVREDCKIVAIPGNAGPGAPVQLQLPSGSVLLDYPSPDRKTS